MYQRDGIFGGVGEDNPCDLKAEGMRELGGRERERERRRERRREREREREREKERGKHTVWEGVAIEGREECVDDVSKEFVFIFV